ncbi:MAG TPA: hypothetical protein VGL02_18090, partial [Streptomyces sp.]
MPSIRAALPALVRLGACLVSCAVLAGCGGSGGSGNASRQANPPTGQASTSPAAATGPATSAAASPSGTPRSTPRASRKPPAPAGGGTPHFGNPGGHAAVPAAARAVDTSHPTRTVGHGSAASCTSAAVAAAVAAGGVITFSCGPNPVVITMTATAKVRNAASSRVVLDGGGKVTLSGGGRHRILYMNTCDQAQGWTTS